MVELTLLEDAQPENRFRGKMANPASSGLEPEDGPNLPPLPPITELTRGYGGEPGSRVDIVLYFEI